MELQAFRNWNGSSSISDDREGGCVDLVLARGREGVQNPENLADVICERPLRYQLTDYVFGHHSPGARELKVEPFLLICPRFGIALHESSAMGKIKSCMCSTGRS